MKNLDIEKATPLWDNVIIKPIKLDSKDQFNRPQQDEDKSELGEVVSVGEGTELVDIRQHLKPGDIVLYNKYSSTPTDVSRHLIVRAEDVIAVWRK